VVDFIQIFLLYIYILFYRIGGVYRIGDPRPKTRFQAKRGPSDYIYHSQPDRLQFFNQLLSNQLTQFHTIKRNEMPLNLNSVYPAVHPEFQSFPSRRSVVHSTQGIVACTQPLAARCGLKILDAGGNAAVSCTYPTLNIIY
jgi:hypothetical protein